MVAGEPSGDLLASHLIAALKAKLPDAVFYGIGGPKMQGQGFDAWWSMEKLSVMGYVDALKNYREISGIRRQLKKRLLDLRPDIFIGVDAPDFNLDLESNLKSPVFRPSITSARRSGPGAVVASRRSVARSTAFWHCFPWSRRSTKRPGFR